MISDVFSGSARWSIEEGDSRKILREIPPLSLDACVTDPPYGLVSVVQRFGAKDTKPVAFGKDGIFQRHSKGFMGQTWDGSGIERDMAFWSGVYRVLKPGAHLAAFGGTRTFHRIACAIEDAGFEIRDTFAWLHGQGMPKSHDLGNGWGTGMKPAQEPILLARKRIRADSVRENRRRYGTGGVNIDDSRIPTTDNWEGNGEASPPSIVGWGRNPSMNLWMSSTHPRGRWPANVLLAHTPDCSEEGCRAGCPVLALDEQSGSNRGGKWGKQGDRQPSSLFFGEHREGITRQSEAFIGDRGGASRFFPNFFYCPKPSPEERARGLEGDNPHPTVKPIALMEWLIRLITPEGGIVLDPFAGSGTTGMAALRLGFRFLGIERDPGYCEIARKRIVTEEKDR